MARIRETDTDALVRFGQYLKACREACVLSQAESAVAMANQPGGLTQAALARLELGKTAIRPETLGVLASVYSVAFDRILSTYVATIMLGQLPPESFERAKRPVILDGGTDRSERSFFASNRLEAWSLEEIAHWESQIAECPNPSLWIISTSFVDHKSEQISDIIVKILLAGGCITYFIAASDTGLGSTSDLLLTTVIKKLKHASSDHSIKSTLKREISIYGLTDPEQAFFTSSVVLGNPDHPNEMDGRPLGFTIVASSGSHSFGIPLADFEVENVIRRARQQKQFREIDRDSGYWKPHALTSHRLYKLEFPHV